MSAKKPGLSIVPPIGKHTEEQLWDAINRIANLTQYNHIKLHLILRQQYLTLGGLGLVLILNFWMIFR